MAAPSFVTLCNYGINLFRKWVPLQISKINGSAKLYLPVRIASPYWLGYGIRISRGFDDSGLF